MDERQFIFGTQDHDLTETKEVKMRLPIAYLIRLHGLKLLTGQNISDTVTKALSMYFANAEEAKARQRESTTAPAQEPAQEPAKEPAEDGS